MKTTEKRTKRRAGEIDLGLRNERIQLGDHIAYFWESERQFEEAIGFLVVGIRNGDHVVVFGHDDANKKVVGVLRDRGIDTDHMQTSERMTVITGGPSGAKMLGTIGDTFARAVERGCGCIRLLGNIGWSKPGWPDDLDILEFEARVTGAAKEFPCVVMCMYDVAAVSGTVMVHGAYETHPLTFCGNVLRENPFYVGVDEYLEQLRAV
jgi:MEDS: MEthanogen/methylotroph, DcmR Sensory domain